MLTFKTNSNIYLQVPTYFAPLSRQKNIFHLGIDFSHFYQIYLVNDSNIFLSIETAINELRSYNFEPIFVFSGISYQVIDCIHSNLLNSVKNFLISKNIIWINSPSTTNAQLSKLYQMRCINAIMCSPTIVLRDVSRWIHFIDFKTKKIIMLRGNLKLMKGILSIRSICEVAAPSFSYEKICWDIKPPHFGLNPPKVPDIPLGLISNGIIRSPFIATYSQNSSKRSLFQLPRNCLNYLNILCGIYFSLFQHLTKLPFNRFSSTDDAPPYDEFLSLLLSQNCITESCELNDSLFSQILAQQNISSIRFKTLFDSLKAISAPQKVSSQKDVTPEFVISESVRRFLTAHEYIAPGGELSPWGRAILVANNGLDMTTVMFIELIRADVMDSDFNSNFGGVGVIDIIERIFSLFPTITKVPPEMISKEKVEDDDISFKSSNLKESENNVDKIFFNKNEVYFSPNNFPSSPEFTKDAHQPPPQLPPSPLFDVDKDQSNGQVYNESINSQLITANNVISLHKINPANDTNNNYCQFNDSKNNSKSNNDNNNNINTNFNTNSSSNNSSGANNSNIYKNNITNKPSNIDTENNQNCNNNFSSSESKDSNNNSDSEGSNSHENQTNNSDCYKQTFNIISDILTSLLRLIICDTYVSISKQPNLIDLKSIIQKFPFHEFTEHSTGVLMRFLLESSDEKRKAFVKSVPRDQLKKDVNNAFNWWKSLNKATIELKQRSLMPNSRVSNLKNFLVMFECANHFVEKTITDVFRIL